jgi:Zn-dependent protease
MEGFRVARILGIEVKVHISWLIIAAFITFTLAQDVMPAWHPSWSPGLNWTVAGMTALLFFVSLLAHEFAHSLVGRSQGMQVDSITLFVFGGVANLGQEPASPGREFWMTVVGPLTSFVIGIASLAGAQAAGLPLLSQNLPHAISDANVLATILVWLGTINVFLAVFNLLPAYPMDGGRLLHAAVWKISGSRLRATLWATRAGRAFASLLIVSGLAMIAGMTVPLFGSGLSGGIWLALIGWFILTAARASYENQAVSDRLASHTVAEMTRPALPAVADPATVIAHSYLSSNVPALVTDEAGVARSWIDPATPATVRSLDALPHLDSSTTLDVAWKQLAGSPLARVTREGEPVGYLLASDVVWLARSG